MRRATNFLCIIDRLFCISIHALREESDCATATFTLNILYFNPRSPWGERQILRYHQNVAIIYFNPRSPWGERLNDLSNRNTDVDISIHALREESDKCYNTNVPVSNKFQSTLSVRRATPLSVNILVGYWFQSTLSVRRATSVLNTCKQSLFISIHALREESDEPYYKSTALIFNFNPRSPWGERLDTWQCSLTIKPFQSTLSVRRATRLQYVWIWHTTDFNPRSPWGERLN